MMMTYQFIVDFNIADSDGDGLVEASIYLMKDLGDGTWNNAPVFEVILAACHGEGLSCTCLSVTENCSVVSLNY